MANRRPQVREPSRCSRSEEFSHHQAEIEGCGVHEESLPDVVIASHMQPSHRTGLVTMRKGSFENLTPTGQQSLAPITSNPSSIRVHRRLRLALCVFTPIPAATIWLGDIRPEFQFRQILQHIVAVIGFVRHDFFDLQRSPGGVTIDSNLMQMTRRFIHRVQNCLCISAIGIVTNHGQDRAMPLFSQVHDVFGLVGQMRGTVLSFS